MVQPVAGQSLGEDVGADAAIALVRGHTEVVDPPVGRVDVDHRTAFALRLADVDGALLEAREPCALRERAVGEALAIEPHGCVEIVWRARPNRELRRAGFDPAMVDLVQPEDRGRTPGGREAGALEKEPARRVPRANRSDDAACAPVLRTLDRRLEENRSDLL